MPAARGLGVSVSPADRLRQRAACALGAQLLWSAKLSRREQEARVCPPDTLRFHEVCALRLRHFPGRGKPAYGTSCHANANRTGEPVAVRTGERHLLQPGEPRQRSAPLLHSAGSPWHVFTSPHLWRLWCHCQA
jgi:hypothetical protein